MTKKDLRASLPHQIPVDVRKMLTVAPYVQKVWEDITPLARNEWLCWIESAKQLKTRNRRIRIMSENLEAGKRRPCCWAGYPHR